MLTYTGVWAMVNRWHIEMRVTCLRCPSHGCCTGTRTGWKTVWQICSPRCPSVEAAVCSKQLTPLL